MQAGSHCCRQDGRRSPSFLPSVLFATRTLSLAPPPPPLLTPLCCLALFADFLSFCFGTVFHLFARNDGRMRPQSVRLRRLLQRRAREAGVPDRLPHGREHLGLRHELGSAGHSPRDWYAILSSVPLPPCPVSQQYVFSKRGGVSVAARLALFVCRSSPWVCQRCKYVYVNLAVQQLRKPAGQPQGAKSANFQSPLSTHPGFPPCHKNAAWALTLAGFLSFVNA